MFELERKKNLSIGSRTALKVDARCVTNLWKHLWSEQKLTLKPAERPMGTRECQEADAPGGFATTTKWSRGDTGSVQTAGDLHPCLLRPAPVS